MRNRYLSTVLDVSAILGVFAIGAFLASSAYGETGMEKPLYDRLGGYDAIAAVCSATSTAR